MTELKEPEVPTMVDAKDPLTESLKLLGGKWKPLIIYHMRKSALRFGEIDSAIPGISRKVLTNQLKELMADGLIIRTAYPESPPRVEYHLTKKGKGLIPIFKALSKWGRYLADPPKVKKKKSKKTT